MKTLTIELTNGETIDLEELHKNSKSGTGNALVIYEYSETLRIYSATGYFNPQKDIDAVLELGGKICSEPMDVTPTVFVKFYERRGHYIEEMKHLPAFIYITPEINEEVKRKL